MGLFWAPLQGGQGEQWRELGQRGSDVAVALGTARAEGWPRDTLRAAQPGGFAGPASSGAGTPDLLSSWPILGKYDTAQDKIKQY